MNWFYQQSRRDQIALLIGATAIIVCGIWLLLLTPLAKATNDYALRYEGAKRSLAQIKALATELQYHRSTQNQSSSPGRGNNVGELVTRTTSANNLSLTSSVPSGIDRLSVKFDNAAFADLMQWLYDLEVNNQVQIEQLNLTPSGQPGFVAATIRLRKM